jgi:hypothetical protein
MQNFFKYGFYVLLFTAITLFAIVFQQEHDAKFIDKRNDVLEAINLALQNNIDNLNEDIDTLKKQSSSIVYRTKILVGKRDSIFVTIDNTNYTDIDSCNKAVKQLFNVCSLDKEIFKLKDSTITTKDSIIYKLELQKGNYTKILDNKEEINQHLQDEIKANKRQKIGQKITIGLLGITSVYLLLNK